MRVSAASAFLTYVLFILQVQAYNYRYIITYGTGNFICHADFNIISYENPTMVPFIIGNSIYCVMGNNEFGDSFDVPVQSANAPNGADFYTLNLNPAHPVNQHGHHGVEIGINQPALTFANNVHLPAVNPRFDMYFDVAGQPLGACSYRQGALQLAQRNGAAVAPYNCPPGVPRGLQIGRWAACLFSCSRF
ncbi:hypothetical protein CTRI78_v010102 [Colletotrichum trifolii]|uniref:Secreted protein n=1 Tax=Colletotrichum trifolii TaxID=5466 RepID=A0A4R8QNZ6_COLTR|nr:hypothetical protein CTRI78_v010102 [Colletotrichum trifolii]